MGRETSLVLAIEPDTSRAEALRNMVRERFGVELVLVSSPYAAIVAMNRQVPELILFSSSLSDRNQNKIISHYRSLTDGIDPQTMIIPLLRDSSEDNKPNSRFSFKWKRPVQGASSDVFLDTIAGYFKPADAAATATPTPETEPATAGVLTPPPPAADDVPVETAAEVSIPTTFAATASAPTTDAAPPEEEPGPEPAPTVSAELLTDAPQTATPAIESDPLEIFRFEEIGEEVSLDVSLDAPDLSLELDEEGTASEDAPAVSTPPGEMITSELATFLSEYDPASGAMGIEVDESASAGDFEDEEDESVDLSSLIAAEPSMPMHEPGVDPEVHAAEIALIKLEAEQKLAAELERLQLEAVQQREEELERLRAEAETLRQTTVAQARQAAEAEAREAWAGELARVRAEAEQTVSEALNRVKVEAEQTLTSEVIKAREEAEVERQAQLAEVQAAYERAREDAERIRLSQLAHVQAAEERVDEVTRLAREAEATAAQERLAQMAQLQAEAEIVRQNAVARARAEAETEAREALTAELARVRTEAEETLNATLNRVRSEAEHTLTAEVSRVREQAEQTRSEELARIQAVVDQRVTEATRVARATAEAEASRTFAEELARARSQAEQTFAAELERAKSEAQQAAAESQRVRDDATLEREAGVARVQAEAEALRQAAIVEARTAAEEAATRAMEREVARVQAEAEARMQEEVNRLRTEAERARIEAEHARSERSEAALEAEKVREAAREVEREIERVRQTSAERLEEEIARVRLEAERARADAFSEREADLARAQAEAESLRQAAITEARAAAEEAAARAMDREITRVKAEAESRVQEEVERLRTEAERARTEHSEVVLEAEKVREAAREVEREIERVRAASAERLQEELERVRLDAERTREAERSAAREEAERLREAAAEDARALAEAALKAELDRVRADAEARIAAEVTQMRAESERQRSTEMADLRAQLSQVRDTAAQHAQKAAADAVAAAEAARANKERAAAPPPLPRPVIQMPPRPDRQGPGFTPQAPDGRTFSMPSMHQTKRADAPSPSIQMQSSAQAEPSYRPAPEARRDADDPRYPLFATPPAEPAWKKWRMPAVAAFLLIAAGTASYNLLPVRVQWKAPVEPVQAAAQPAPVPVAKRVGGDVTFESTPPGATVLIDGKSRGVAPLTIKDLSVGTHNVVFETEGVSINRPVRVRADQPLTVTQDMTAGFLSVFSRIPVEIRVDGRRAGSTDDGQLVVAPGSRSVVLENKHFNFKSEFTIEIKPSEVTAHTVMLPMGALLVTTEPGAEVFVEGERVGVAPLGPMAVPIGTREITVKHANGEVKQSVEIVYGRQSEVAMPIAGMPTAAPGTLPVQMPPLSAPPGPRR